MSRNSILALVLVLVGGAGALSAPADGPGLRHRAFMAGSVLESTETEIYLCIGTSEGAEVGQELDVVRVTRDTSTNPKHGLRFKHRKVGTVRIDAIVDEHFAKATVVGGEGEKGDIVRLSDSRDGEAHP